MQAELPLEYHAIYIAQKTLPNRNMPNPNLPKRKRRDAACATPVPPPKEVEYRTSPKYEDDRRRFESYQMFLQQGWVSDFHAQHPSAEHFAHIANGCKGHARG